MELFQDKKDKKDCTLDMGRGCEFCGCGGEELSAGVCEGCFKLHVTDWLKDYPDTLPGDIYEVRFKNTRRGYYQNVNGLSLKEGDIVAVEAAPGHDIGIVSLSGDMVARQMRRVGFNPQNGEFKKIYRKAKPYDIEKWQEAIALEHGTMIKARQIAAEMNLNMKIGDVEYQGDKIKAIFYYIADERVDFRELIKVFAEVFHIRVEMKQIGARQEAGRIGGIGPCGRELCCATWMKNFVSVSTGAARYQDISLNPQKLAGQCAKLKCCMNYEVDTYVEAGKRLPSKEITLQTQDAEYYFFKADILAGLVTYSTDKHLAANLVTLTTARVFEIINMNRRGEKPQRLESGEAAEPAKPADLVEQESLTRFDKRRKNKGKRKDNGNPRGSQSSKETQGAERREENTGKDRRNRNRGRDNKEYKGEQGGNRENRPGKDKRKRDRDNRSEKAVKPAPNTPAEKTE